MRKLVFGIAAVTALTATAQPAAAWMHAGRYGEASGGGGSWQAQGWHGGTASGGGGWWSAQNWRGSASGGDGSWNASGR